MTQTALVKVASVQCERRIAVVKLTAMLHGGSLKFNAERCDVCREHC